MGYVGVITDPNFRHPSSREVHTNIYEPYMVMRGMKLPFPKGQPVFFGKVLLRRISWEDVRVWWLTFFFGVFGLKVCVLIHCFDFSNFAVSQLCVDKVDPRKESKISPTYPWKIPQMFHQQFMKDFSFFVRGYLPRVMSTHRSAAF